MPPPMYGPPAKPKTMKTMIAGILLIIAGINAIAFWGTVFTNPLVLGFAAVIPGLAAVVLVCGAIAIILSILTLLGGVMALTRKMWGLALLGSILGLFTLGFYLVSSLFALIALILIAISRNEF